MIGGAEDGWIGVFNLGLDNHAGVIKSRDWFKMT